LQYVRDEFGQIDNHPTALIGMSGGAMVLPVVYTLNPDSYDAAVLIAGGANSMLINATTNYDKMIDAVRFDFDPSTPEIDGSLGRELLETLEERYLENTKLDAAHTAKEMTGIPILQLHASKDKAVPSRSGDLLHEALGQPERWTYPVGHELIFAALPIQVPKIHKWLVGALELE
jgi:predicted esterase